MIEDYKYINGVYFGERKHWLQDDYVKFIRFGERVIEKVAMVFSLLSIIMHF